MSHLVESMAYTGSTPWHGLGQHLSPQQPIATWLTEAGMVTVHRDCVDNNNSCGIG